MKRFGRAITGQAKAGKVAGQATAGKVAGQATVEYILLLMIILASVFVGMKGLSTAFERGLTSLGGKLEKNLKTGRASITVFKN